MLTCGWLYIIIASIITARQRTPCLSGPWCCNRRLSTIHHVIVGVRTRIDSSCSCGDTQCMRTTIGWDCPGALYLLALPATCCMRVRHHDIACYADLPTPSSPIFTTMACLHQPNLHLPHAVFGVTQFSGTPTESDEMAPQWFSHQDIPFHQMWADDVHWCVRPAKV